MKLDTVVVGAGRAGLAAAWHLRAARARFVVLEREARAGDSWRRRYDALTLFTPGSLLRTARLVVPARSGGVSEPHRDG